MPTASREKQTVFRKLQINTRRKLERILPSKIGFLLYVLFLYFLIGVVLMNGLWLVRDDIPGYWTVHTRATASGNYTDWQLCDVWATVIVMRRSGGTVYHLDAFALRGSDPVINADAQITPGREAEVTDDNGFFWYVLIPSDGVPNVTLQLVQHALLFAGGAIGILLTWYWGHIHLRKQ